MIKLKPLEWEHFENCDTYLTICPTLEAFIISDPYRGWRQVSGMGHLLKKFRDVDDAKRYVEAWRLKTIMESIEPQLIRFKPLVWRSNTNMDMHEANCLIGTLSICPERAGKREIVHYGLISNDVPCNSPNLEDCKTACENYRLQLFLNDL
jgi:hypothetical protein